VGPTCFKRGKGFRSSSASGRAIDGGLLSCFVAARENSPWATGGGGWLPNKKMRIKKNWKKYPWRDLSGGGHPTYHRTDHYENGVGEIGN